MADRAGLVRRLVRALGPDAVLERPEDMAPHLVDWRGAVRAGALAVVRPDSTAAVSRAVELCAEAGVGVVPQGGNTGMMAGSVPAPDGDQVVLALGRLRRVRAIDPLNYTLTAEAGCVLADLQRVAAEHDRLFPLSLAAEGSCQIGGNLATNAGGTAVLRYGNARDLVLGLEVVLADGRVWDGLRALRKDNAGYDLKQLFLGSEGTLGIITAAVLKLFPRPEHTRTAMVAVLDPAAALELLARARAASGDAVVTFEYVHRACLDVVAEHVPDATDPFPGRHEHYVLLELAGGGAGLDLGGVLETVLGDALAAGLVRDAVIAASEAQAARLWRLRESIPEANTRAGGCIRHDVSVPVARVPELLERGAALCRERIPGVRVTPFGHLGDGNIHFNLVRPPGLSPPEFLSLQGEVTPDMHDLVASMGGSFSAEHGIGQLKRGELERYRGGVELELMRALKRTLDPAGVLNPGKVV